MLLESQISSTTSSIPESDIPNLPVLNINTYRPSNLNPVINLKAIQVELGDNFIIEYEKMQVPVILYMATLNSNNIKFYILEYDDKNYTEILRPFSIYFLNYSNPEEEMSYTTYISSIHKTSEISGSQMVKLVLQINKVLGVKKTTLHDGTTITCPINGQKLDLSYLKLLQYGRTFYTNLGFEFAPRNENLASFKNIQELHKHLDIILDKISKIKVSDIISEFENVLIIITKVIINQDYDNLHIKNINEYPIKTPIQTYYVKNIKQKIVYLFDASSKILDILHETKETYLKDVLVNVFNDKMCFLYYYLQMYLIDDVTYSIEYHDTKIVRDYLKLFGHLHLLKNREYIYYFDK